MPLVFIHGINTRRGQSIQQIEHYEKKRILRENLFQSVSFVDAVPDRIRVIDAYWGDLGATFRHGLVCVPGDSRYESLGPDDEAFDSYLPTILENVTRESLNYESDTSFLLSVAREEGLPLALDILIPTLITLEAEENMTRSDSAEYQNVIDSAEQLYQYAERVPRPEWLENVSNDDEFIRRLCNEAFKVSGNIEPLGPGFDIIGLYRSCSAKLCELVSSIKSDVVNGLEGIRSIGQVVIPVVTGNRRKMSEYLGRGIGDVFVYLARRGSTEKPGGIIQTIMAKIGEANAAKSSKDEKLVVVGHSLGGVIAYDVFTNFMTDIQCDLLITIGSQVGLFEELGLFNESESVLSGSKMSRPNNIGQWLNVFDKEDLLSFRISEIFDQTSDFEFDNRTLPGLAHTTYLHNRRFHKKLRDHVTKALTVTA